MAKVVINPDWSDRRASRESIYPWDKWLDGQTWEITQGEDFDCLTKSMRIRILNTANKRNLRVRTKLTSPNTIMFKVVE